jgi:hypothetical protein
MAKTRKVFVVFMLAFSFIAFPDTCELIKNSFKAIKVGSPLSGRQWVSPQNRPFWVIVYQGQQMTIAAASVLRDLKLPQIFRSGNPKLCIPNCAPRI